MTDPHNLQRFVHAQEPVYTQVCAELAEGHKRSHWMWFVFPQLKDLGRSQTARHYGIASLAEAQAYAEHALLGERLRACTRLMLAIEGRTALQILGSPDHLKFHSCMTLFARAQPPEPLFPAALARYFGGVEDEGTLALLLRSGA